MYSDSSICQHDTSSHLTPNTKTNQTNAKFIEITRVDRLRRQLKDVNTLPDGKAKQLHIDYITLRIRAAKLQQTESWSRLRKLLTRLDSFTFHKIPVGTLVEVVNSSNNTDENSYIGIRLYVVGHSFNGHDIIYDLGLLGNPALGECTIIVLRVTEDYIKLL